MSGPRDETLRRLERRLAELEPAARSAPGPELRESSLRVRAAERIGLHDERRDPLTGHRGVAEGLLLLFRAGEVLVELQVRDEATGPVLRGQLLPVGEDQEPPAGALLHVRCGGLRLLACADSRGELVLHDLPAAPLDELVLELEEGAHRLPWPAPGEPSA